MKIEGKRHSRVHRYGPGEERPAGELIPWSWAEVLGDIRESFAAELRRCGLPDQPWIWFAQDGTRHSLGLPEARPEEWEGGLELHLYVRELGFARDSPEELVARVIVTVARIAKLESTRPDLALALAVELGRLMTLYQVYTADAAGPRKGGIKSARARKREAQQRKLILSKAALDLLARNRSLSKNRIAEILAERGHGGIEAIKKLLPKLPAKKREG